MSIAEQPQSSVASPNSYCSDALLLETALTIDEAMLSFHFQATPSTIRRHSSNSNYWQKPSSDEVSKSTHLHHWHRDPTHRSSNNTTTTSNSGSTSYSGSTTYSSTGRCDSKSYTDIEDDFDSDQDDTEDVFRHVDSVPSLALLHSEELVRTQHKTAAEQVDEGEEEEYGFYDDCEEFTHIHHIPKFTPLRSSYQPVPSPSHSNSNNNSNSDTNKVCNSSKEELAIDAIIATASTTPSSSYEDLTINHQFPTTISSSRLFEEHRVSLTCRSFPVEHVHAAHCCTMHNSRCGEHLDVCLAIAGVRILSCRPTGNHPGSSSSSSSSEVAEYKIQLFINGVMYSTWKRFEDFQLIAEACQRYMDRPVVLGSYHTELAGALDAWMEVLEHRPYWCQPRNYVLFVQEESALLQEFLKELLFEIPTVTLLLEFIL